MMAHELLRQAALILTAGWSKNADAHDDADRIVRLWEMMRSASFHCRPARSCRSATAVSALFFPSGWMINCARTSEPSTTVAKRL